MFKIELPINLKNLWFDLEGVTLIVLTQSHFKLYKATHFRRYSNNTSKSTPIQLFSSLRLQNQILYYSAKSGHPFFRHSFHSRHTYTRPNQLNL